MTPETRVERGAVTRATLLLVCSACCFGSIGVLVSLATARGAGLLDVLFWRYAIAAVMLVVVSGGIAAVRMGATRALLLLLVAGGGQAAVAFTSLSALKYIPVATLTFLFYTYPAWVTIFAAVRGEDRLTPRRVGALVMSLAGLALMIGTPAAGALNPIGVALALGSALLYALYIPMINRFGSGLPASVTAAYAAAGAAIVFCLAAVPQSGLSISHSVTVWGLLALLAVVCTVLAFIAFLRALAVIGPVRTAIVSTIEPFWTAVLGALVLGQGLTARTVAGGLMIAAAVVLLQLTPRVEPGS